MPSARPDLWNEARLFVTGCLFHERPTRLPPSWACGPTRRPLIFTKPDFARDFFRTFWILTLTTTSSFKMSNRIDWSSRPPSTSHLKTSSWSPVLSWVSSGLVCASRMAVRPAAALQMPGCKPFNLRLRDMFPLRAGDHLRYGIRTSRPHELGCDCELPGKHKHVGVRVRSGALPLSGKPGVLRKATWTPPCGDAWCLCCRIFVSVCFMTCVTFG